jgi:hypothetical protein
MNAIYQELEKLCREQYDSEYIITGFYLTTDQYNFIASSLEPDDPPIGARGRFLGVPVYKIGDRRISKNSVRKIGTVNNIKYTYIYNIL